MKYIVKIIFWAFCVLLITCFWVLLTKLVEANTEYEYCGTVTAKYITEAGYKVTPKHRVVFYCDSLKKKINIAVTPNTYSNSYIGKHVCFDLFKLQTE